MIAAQAQLHIPAALVTSLPSSFACGFNQIVQSSVFWTVLLLMGRAFAHCANPVSTFRAHGNSTVDTARWNKGGTRWPSTINSIRCGEFHRPLLEVLDKFGGEEDINGGEWDGLPATAWRKKRFVSSRVHEDLLRTIFAVVMTTWCIHC